MEEIVQNAFFSGVAKIGDGVSWVTEKIIKWIAQYGYNITPLQSKILTLLVFGALIYVVLGVMTIGKKLLKWALVIGAIFLMLSVLLSIFI